jgi:hypothetical protein
VFPTSNRRAAGTACCGVCHACENGKRESSQENNEKNYKDIEITATASFSRVFQDKIATMSCPHARFPVAKPAALTL